MTNLSGLICLFHALTGMSPPSSPHPGVQEVSAFSVVCSGLFPVTQMLSGGLPVLSDSVQQCGPKDQLSTFDFHTDVRGLSHEANVLLGPTV